MHKIKAFTEQHKRGSTDEVEVVLSGLNVDFAAEIFGKLFQTANDKFDFILVAKNISEAGTIAEKYSQRYCSSEKLCSLNAVYNKRRRHWINIAPKVRINHKTETPVKIVPNVSRIKVIRILGRFKFHFEDFVADFSFVRHVNIRDASEGAVRTIFTREINEFVDKVLGKKKVATQKDAMNVLVKRLPKLPNTYGRLELEFEMKRKRIENEDLLMELLKFGAKHITLDGKDVFDDINDFGRKIGLLPSDLRNKVIDMHFNELKDLAKRANDPKGWAISYKKDGHRATIYVDGLNNVIILFEDQPLIISPPLDMEMSKIGRTVIDSEYIPETNTFYLFDISLYDGRPASFGKGKDRFGLKARLSLLEDLCDRWFSEENLKRLGDFFSGKKIEMAKFHFPTKKEGLDDIAKGMLARVNELPFEIDGLIYTQITGKYKDKILRWKPQNRQTIDFLVLENPMKIERERYIYTLYCYVTDDAQEVYNGETVVIFPEKFGSMKFARFGQKPEMYRLESKKELVNQGIYELGRVGSSWEIFRHRDKRDKPNFYDVALDVYRLMQNPITPAQISDFGDKTHNSYYQDIGAEGELFKRYKKFINAAKSMVIQQQYPVTNREKGEYSVTDIGAGRANDIHKWRARGVKKVWAIEPSPDNVMNGMARVGDQKITRYNPVPIDVEFIQSDFFGAMDNQILKKKIGHGTQDVVEAFFSSHYFLEKESDYDKYLKGVSSLLKPGGRFITVEINGRMLYDWAKKRNKIVVREFTSEDEDNYYQVGLKGTKGDPSEYLYFLRQKDIERKEGFNLGMKAITSISSIAPAVENLVDLNLLTTMSGKHGLKFISSVNFGKWYSEVYLKKTNRKSEITSSALRNVAKLDEVLIFEKIKK